jgi:3-mercaptopyruvate sulfurtransferase SseA
LLVLAGAAFGLAVNAGRGVGGIALGRPVHSTAEGGACVGVGSPEEAIQVGIQEAAQLRGHAGVVFGDTRPADQYAQGHVAGAWHLPCFGSAAVAASSLEHFARAQTLIVYGDGEGAGDARLAQAELRRRGWQDVRVLAGGWRAWRVAGLPAESGPCEVCKKP